MEDTDRKKVNLLASTPVVVCRQFGTYPSIEEYKAAVVGIDLTKFSPLTTV